LLADGRISDFLIPILLVRFPDRGLTSGIPPEPCVTFPAIRPEAGDIQIYDDDGEITLVAGQFTHGHFSNYDDIPIGEKEKAIAEDVAIFLEKLFSDQVVLGDSNKSGGRWRVVDRDSADEKEQDIEDVGSGPRQIRQHFGRWP
jgi:hypothetical protein